MYLHIMSINPIGELGNNKYEKHLDRFKMFFNLLSSKRKYIHMNTSDYCSISLLGLHIWGSSSSSSRNMYSKSPSG